MMDFAPRAPRRRPGENIVPMINVVFLLLIFFLMSAQIAPPDPFAVTPPGSRSEDQAMAADTLYVSAGGLLAYEGITGDAALDALRLRDGGTPLAIRADARLPAADLAALLPRLAAAGVERTLLVTGAE